MKKYLCVHLDGRVHITKLQAEDEMEELEGMEYLKELLTKGTFFTFETINGHIVMMNEAALKRCVFELVDELNGKP